ncbi:MAG: type I methionyl aminopeptidase [Thermoflexales bacterium]|nr:type I methionyl aminopeptidase [Thermoflexales bacterium]MDW8292370.1 type I methionyl aminopeptidase [Anaerolineae bacterium]
MIVLKTEQEIAKMRRAGKVVATVLAELRERARPGVKTIELDQIAERIILQHGAQPSFKNYKPQGAPYPFPACICTSINDEVVHGIPGERRLREGDVLKIDVGASVEGYHADAAITVGVGAISERAQRLIEVTQACLAAAIAAARSGNRSGDIGAAIQRVAESRGFSVVREYTSHGVGRALHEGFTLPNFGQPGTGLLLRPGLTLAIEPMINEGNYRTRVKRDGWTVATIDGKLSAQFEHTVAITEGEAEILTLINV